MYKRQDKFSELINPQKDISYKIQELTGITNDMVKDKPTIDEAVSYTHLDVYKRQPLSVAGLSINLGVSMIFI